MHRSKQNIAVLLALCLTLLAEGFSQPQLQVPQPSPSANLSQAVGIAEVKVSYHRPAVKGRTVWGALVPYNEIWRAGANENTVLTFSNPVRVGGKELAAGSYGLHMIPTPSIWTVILSKNSTSWGSYFYKEEEDALRITVTPQQGEFTEWLQYEFSDLTDTGAVLSLRWEKLRIPIAIDVDTRGHVLAKARDEYLRGAAGFTWQGFNQAAQYALRAKSNLDEALQWANRSTGMVENFTNLRTKAAILEALGRNQEAAPLHAKAMKIATEADINTLGYTLLGQKKIKEAIEMFEKNVKDYPDSWNVYDSLAEGLENSGDMKGAIKNYEKALQKTTDESQKKRIASTLKRLRGN